MRKLRPSNYWNIGKIESWLSDMALEGYFLQNMDKNFCEFEKGDPKTLSYRIEIAEDGKDLSRDQHLKYMRDIWTNTTNFNKFHVFSCPYEFVSPEPNPYPEELAKSLKPIFRKNLLALLGIILGSLAAIWFFPYLLNEMLIVKTLNGSTADMVTLLIVLYAIFTLLRELYFQGRLIRKLSKGIPINHHAQWRKTYWTAYSFWLGRNLLIIGIFLSSFFLLFADENALPKGDSKLPIVRLETIETADGSSFDYSKLGTATYYKSFSLIAPLQYSSKEYLGTDPYKVTSLETATYKLAIPSMNKFIVTALVSNYDRYYDEIYRDKLTFPEPITNEFFDILVVRDNSYANELFAAKGRWVIHLTYIGDKSTDDMIKAAADLLNKIKET